MKLLTLARDLKRRKGRERQQLFVSEGVRAVEELLRSPLTIRGALIAPHLAEAPRGEALRAALKARGVTIEETEGKDFGSAAETESPQGVVAIAEIPERSVTSLAPDVHSEGIVRWNGADWSAVGTGEGIAGQGPLALRAFDDGSGPGLYAFPASVAGSSLTKGIAKWVGQGWSPLGSGIVSSSNLGEIEVYVDGSGAALHVAGSYSSQSGAP